MATPDAVSPHGLYVLDTSALIYALEDAPAQVPTPDVHNDLPAIHAEMLANWKNFAQGDSYALRIPDFTVYEYTGLLPSSTRFAMQRFAALKDQHARGMLGDAQYAEELHNQITLLVDSSVRIDRKRGITSGVDQNNSPDKTRDHSYQFYTLLAYHPEIVVHTQVGRELSQSAAIESAVVAGIGVPPGTKPGKDTASAYAQRMQSLARTIEKTPEAAQDMPDIGHYRLSFDDVKHALGGKFKPGSLRMHWGQLYFSGLINERVFREKIDSDPQGTAANPANGHDDNMRFVTVGKLTRLQSGKGFRFPGHESSDYVTFDMLQEARPDVDVARAMGPAKITVDQLIFGNVLMYASDFRKDASQDFTPSAYFIRSLATIAKSLGYEANPTTPISDYQAMHESLKKQGLFERFVTLEDMERIQKALHAEHIGCERLDAVLNHMPQELAAKPRMLSEQVMNSGKNPNVPLEKIFTDALVNGALTPPQFATILLKIHAAEHIERTPAHDGGMDYRIEQEGIALSFHARQSISNKMKPSAQASVIDADSVTLHFSGEPITNRAHRSDFLWHGNQPSVPLAELITQCHAERMGTTQEYHKSHRYLEALLYPSFNSSENAGVHLTKGLHTMEQFYPSQEEGQAQVSQLLKDFETRHERRFIPKNSTLPPAASSFASNHRNRRALRRNMGEVALVEAAGIVGEGTRDKVWVVTHDQDLVSFQQHEAFRERREPEADADQSAGVLMDPQVTQQHSRYVRHTPLYTQQLAAKEGDARFHVVPTRDFLQVMQGRSFSEGEGKNYANRAHTYSREFQAQHAGTFGR